MKLFFLFFFTTLILSSCGSGSDKNAPPENKESDIEINIYSTQEPIIFFTEKEYIDISFCMNNISEDVINLNFLTRGDNDESLYFKTGENEGSTNIVSNFSTGYSCNDLALFMNDGSKKLNDFSIEIDHNENLIRTFPVIINNNDTFSLYSLFEHIGFGLNTKSVSLDSDDLMVYMSSFDFNDQGEPFDLDIYSFDLMDKNIEILSHDSSLLMYHNSTNKIISVYSENNNELSEIKISHDKGISWIVSYPETNTEIRSNLKVCGKDGDHFYLYSNKLYFEDYFDSSLIFSLDGGITWQHSDTLHPYVEFLDCSDEAEGLLYASAGFSYYKSEDYGLTWNPVLPSFSPWKSAAVDPFNHEHVLFAYQMLEYPWDKKIYETFDGGVTFNELIIDQLSEQMTPTAISFNDSVPGLIYLTTQETTDDGRVRQTLLRSIDYGRSFSIVNRSRGGTRRAIHTGKPNEMSEIPVILDIGGNTGFLFGFDKVLY